MYCIRFFIQNNNNIRLIYIMKLSDCRRFACAAVNLAENEKSEDHSTAVSDQVEASLASVSADGSNTVAPSEIETVNPTTAEDTSSVPVAASDTKPPPPRPPVKRKRGRPPLHSYQATERRHAKLLDVCTHCILAGALVQVLPTVL